MKSESQNSVRYLLAIAGLGGLLYGIDFGVIAAASPYIKALRLFSDAEISWIVGAVLFGGIVSSLTAGMLAERFGRRGISSPGSTARQGGREIQSRAFLDEVGIGNAASARKAAIRLCELRYIYLFRGEYRFTSMFFRAWLLRQDW